MQNSAWFSHFSNSDWLSYHERVIDQNKNDENLCKQYWRRYRRDREMKIQQFLMLKHESLRRDKDLF